MHANKPKMAILGTTAKNVDTMVGAPSYTSMAHMWNGAAEILSDNETRIKIKPTINIVGVE